MSVLTYPGENIEFHWQQKNPKNLQIGKKKKTSTMGKQTRSPQTSVHSTGERQSKEQHL